MRKNREAFLRRFSYLAVKIMQICDFRSKFAAKCRLPVCGTVFTSGTAVSVRRVLRTHPCAGEPQVSKRRFKFLERCGLPWVLGALNHSIFCARDHFDPLGITHEIITKKSFMFSGCIWSINFKLRSPSADLWFTSTRMGAKHSPQARTGRDAM